MKKCLGAGHLSKKFARVAGICQILKIYPRIARGEGMVILGVD